MLTVKERGVGGGVKIHKSLHTPKFQQAEASSALTKDIESTDQPTDRFKVRQYFQGPSLKVCKADQYNKRT